MPTLRRTAFRLDVLKIKYIIMKKQILNLISRLDERNQKLFDEKAKLERNILEIDLEIWHIGNEYQGLIKKLLKTK